MDLYRRILLAFFGILIPGWLSLQLALYSYLGMLGVLLPGLLFGLPFALVNFKGVQEKIRAALLNTFFATASIIVGFLVAFTLGPEGAGAEGFQFGLLLGFGCAAPLTIMLFAAYRLSWPSMILAIALGSLLPAVAGFEGAQEATVKPELFAYFWLAVMGGVFSWGVRERG
ncbi:MAG: hypothetical protein KDD06_24390 [Phaeodactylibacter sp.]|nr:hypothetical protein [Phaeodactylibacter sp.]MCB9286332.1 hypothetical protein [Lewinellaceae bacterium]